MTKCSVQPVTLEHHSVVIKAKTYKCFHAKLFIKRKQINAVNLEYNL